MFPGMPIILLSLLVTDPAAPGGNLATEGFRAEHKVLHVELDQTAALVAQLESLPADEQKAAMEKVIAFVSTRIAPHAGFEEKVLYPLVDRQAKSGDHPFTATMSYEHRIVERWLGELKKIAASPQPAVATFVHKSNQLLGLIAAHFENEEEVLLPVIDKTMTAEQFEEAMHGPSHEH